MTDGDEEAKKETLWNVICIINKNETATIYTLLDARIRVWPMAVQIYGKNY